MQITGLSLGGWTNGSKSWSETSQQQTGRAQCFKCLQVNCAGQRHGAWKVPCCMISSTGHSTNGQVRWGNLESVAWPLRTVEVDFVENGTALVFQASEKVQLCAQLCTKTHWKQIWCPHLSNVASQHPGLPEFYTQSDYPTVGAGEVTCQL